MNIQKLGALTLLAQINLEERLSLARAMFKLRSEGFPLLPDDIWAILYVRSLRLEDGMNQLFDWMYEVKMCLLEGKPLTECL